MSLYEFQCVVEGVAIRNGQRKATEIQDDDFLADLALSKKDGSA